MSIDNYNYSDISKVLNAVQYFGDLNPKLLGAIIGVKEATGIMETLRKKSTFSVTFFARETIMGLRKYFVSLKIPPTLISLVDLYEVLDGFPSFIGRDFNSPENTIMIIPFPKGKTDFIRALEELADAGLVHNLIVRKFVRQYQFYTDFSTFDFEKNTFKENFLVQPRSPLILPDLSDGFRPDWLDLAIMGKKQGNNKRTLKEIASLLNVPYRVALKHYQEHIIGRSLVEGYVMRWDNSDGTRLTILFKRDENFLSELTRIPTLTHAADLDDGTSVAFIFADQHMIPGIMDYVAYLRLKFKMDAKVMVHLFKPRFKYLLAASIPYEHYTESRTWVYDLDKMLQRARELARKLELLPLPTSYPPTDNIP